MTNREEKAFQQGLQRFETLIQTIQTTAPPAMRASIEELVQTLLELHGVGIERMLDLIWEIGDAATRSSTKCWRRTRSSAIC